MAVGVLAICWRDSSILAYNMLSKCHEDYNNKTVIEIAYDAAYIHFLAHPCCQKWLTKTFFGNLQVKELDWGIFRLPYWFKVSQIFRASDFFQDLWAEVTHGAKNGGSFCEMIGPSISN